MGIVASGSSEDHRSFQQHNVICIYIETASFKVISWSELNTVGTTWP
jgi:hypothetical protein